MRLFDPRVFHFCAIMSGEGGLISPVAWQESPLTIIGMLNAAVAFAAALWVLRLRPARGARTFAVMLFCLAAWAAALAFERLAPSPEAKMFWTQMQVLPSVTVPAAALAFSRRFRQQRRPYGRKETLLLAIEPLLTMLLTWTNKLHGLMWPSAVLISQPGGSVLAVTHGAWYWLHSAYSYLLCSLSLLMIGQGMRQAPRTLRRQGLAMLLAAFASWAGYLVSVIQPLIGQWTVGLGMSMSNAFMLWAVLRLHLFSLVPVAREAVIEQLQSAILVLDARGNVVDLNAAAYRLLGLPEAQLIGQPVATALAGHEPLLERLGNRFEAHEQFIWGEDEQARCFDLHVSPLQDADGQVAGRLVMVSDVTPLWQAEEASSRRAQQLAALQRTVLDLTTHQELPILLHDIVQRATELLHAPSGGLYLTDAKAREVRCAVSYNTVQDFTGTVLLYGEGAAGTVAETGQPLVVNDYRTWNHRAAPFEQDQPFRAVASAPMVWNGQVTGVIHVLDSAEQRSFSQSDVELLTLFAGHAAIAVENARLIESAQQELAERRRVQEFNEGIVQGMAEGLLIEDGHGLISFVNPALCRMLGYAAQDLIGRPWHDLIPEAAREPLTRRFSDTNPANSDRYETQLRSSDGRVIPVLVSARPSFREGALRGAISAFTDISRLKRLEAEVEKRRLYLESVLEAAPDAIVSLDPQHRVVEWNLGAQRLWGYSAEEARGRNLDDLVSSPDKGRREEVLAVTREVLSGRTVAPREAVRWRRDGTPVDVILAGSPIVVNGQLTGVVAVYSDISAQKAVQRRLEESQARYRAVVEDQTEMVSRFLPDGTMTFVNGAVCRFLGRPREEMIGTNLMGYVPEEEQLALKKVLASLSPERPVLNMENRVLHSNGQFRCVQWTDRGIFDGQGKLVEVQSVGRDVTEQKKAEAALLEAEAKYRSLVETSPDGITLTGLDGKVLLCNRQTALLHGYSDPQHMVGLDSLDLIAPEDHPRARENLQHTLEKGSVHGVNYAFLRQDGSRFPGELSASLIRDSMGEPSAFIGLTRDITERKRAEEQLRSSLQEKETLLREVHHRVKNNLQVISSLLYLQSLKAETHDPDILFRESRDQVHSMALVHEKLSSSSDLARVDFAAYVGSLTASLLQSYRASSAVNMVLDIDQSHLDVDLAMHCGLIINELVSNALRHAFSQKAEGEIRVQYRGSGGRGRLCVSDNGVGLPADFALERGDSLGLNLVQMLVQQLDGKLSVERGGGTRFRVEFPTKKA
jgi:PAS domain S-box-containing protein